jgi:ADP-ribose pyrophosphatase YjhB (NUDIX family)
MKKIIVDHHIQRDILRRLAEGSKRFSQLKPSTMESNLFMYHVSSLRKAGLIEKAGTQYQLTHEGMTYVDRLSKETFRPRLQPKTVALFVIHNAQGEIAVLKRNIEPYIDYLMLPTGKMHYGESLVKHAARELKEKTGLELNLTYRGVVNVVIEYGGVPLTHIIAIVWSTVVPNEATIHCSHKNFTAMWADQETLAKQEVPGSIDIVRLCETNSQPFMADLILPAPS